MIMTMSLTENQSIQGKETSDLDNGRQWPFFEEMQAVFTKRENNMHRLHLESEAGSVQAKNTVKRINTDHSYEALSEDEDEDDCESEEVTRSSNPRKRKVGKEKLSQMLAMEKPSKQPSIAYTNINNTTSLTTIQEMLRDFIQQQKIIDMEWRESIEKRAYARQLFEQEWHRSMEKLEQERMMIEQAWREREEQRRLRDESRAEKRDALLTDLLNRLIHEDHH